MAITAETRTDIIEIVVGVIGAAPGANILSELADIVDGGLSLRDLTIALVENPVFKEVYPSFLTDEEFATQYLADILDGEVSAETMDEAIDVVTALLNAGESRGSVVYEIIQFLSNTSVDDEVFGAAAANLANKTEVAEAYSVDTLQSGDTLEELQSVIADVDSTEASKTAALEVVAGTENTGTKFTLTLGADEITGTTKNDTFISGDLNDGNGNIENTLSSLDILDGAGGTDTLKIFAQDEDVNIASTTVVQNIEKLVVNAAEEFNGDLSDWTGLMSVNLQVVGDDLDIILDGQTVTGNNLDGDVDIEGAATISLTDVDDNSNMNIHTDGQTTSISIVGGHSIDIDDDANNNTSTSLTTASFEANDGNISINSSALSTLSLIDLDTNVALLNDGTLVDTLDLTVDGFDGNLADNNSNFETVNLMVTGDSDFNANLNGMTDLVVTGSADAEIDGTATNLETITVSGSAGLTVDTNSLGAAANLVSITATDTDGDVDVTVDGGAVLETIALGAGDDAVDILSALTGAVDTTVSLGAGDDSFTLNSGLVHDANTEIDGGDGEDTLHIFNGADADTAGEAAIFSNFETLEVGGGTGTYALDVLGLTDITISSNLAGAVVLDQADAAAEISVQNEVAATDLDVNQDIQFALADDNGNSDSLTINLDAIDGDNDGTAEGAITLSGVTLADGIETVTINGTASVLDADKATTPATDESTTSNEYTHTVSDLQGDAIETLVITGDAIVDVTVDVNANNTTDALAQIDATGATSGVVIDVSGKGGTGVTFNGSSAVDTYTASGNGDTIQANGGVNTTTGAADAITLGGGADTVRYVAASDSAGIFFDANDDGNADAIILEDTVTGFSGSAGDGDQIELSSQLGLAGGDARAALLQKGTFASVAALEDAVGDGVDFFDTGLVDRAVAVADTGGNGYVFVDANADGDFTQGVDMIIQLVGVTAITVDDVSFG